MKFTKGQLKRIIKELTETDPGPIGFVGAGHHSKKEEEEEHPVETEETGVLGKGKLFKGQRMKTPSGLGYGLDYTSEGADLNESVADLDNWESYIEEFSAEMTGLFGDTMSELFHEDPEAFRGRSDYSGWMAQVHNAQMDLGQLMIDKINEAVMNVEARLHSGDYSNTPDHE